MKPSELVPLRRELVEWLRSEKAAAFFNKDWNEAELLGRHGLATARQFLAVQPVVVGRAPLYFIADHMTPLCVAAGESLPPLHKLSADDLPSRDGVMLWGGDPIQMDTLEDTGETRALFAVSWCVEPTDQWSQKGFLLTMYEDRERGDFGPLAGSDAREKSRLLFPRMVDMGRMLVGFGESWDDTLMEPEFSDSWTRPLFRTLLATWMLMKQSIITSEPVRFSRGERRQAERAGETDLGVTLVRLRRMVHRDQREGDDRDSPDWTCRWLVSGHWRQQWLPSQGVHRPTWIAPYVKGPEDKPLRVTEKVTVLQR